MRWESTENTHSNAGGSTLKSAKGVTLRSASICHTLQRPSRSHPASSCPFGEKLTNSTSDSNAVSSARVARLTPS